MPVVRTLLNAFVLCFILFTVASRAEDVNLALVCTVDNARPNVGQNVVVKVAITNTSLTTAATNVSVSSLLPSGLSFVSASAGQGSYVSGTGVWIAGTIAADATVSLLITASIDSGALPSVTHQANITAVDQNDPEAANNQDSIIITPLQADLRIENTVTNGTPTLGNNVTFTVVIKNKGPDGATGIVVNDLLPAGLTFVSSTASQGTYTSFTGNWLIGTLSSDAAATLTLVATAAQFGVRTATAQVSATDTYDPDSGNNSVAVPVDTGAPPPPPQADLSLTQTVDNASPLVNSGVTITIKVRNNTGPSNATGVQVTDILPAGLSFVSANATDGSYDDTTGIWNVGTLNNGATASLTINATLTSTSPVTNTAQVTASGASDPDSTVNNSVAGEDDQDSITIRAKRAELAVTNTVSNFSPPLNQTVVFTARVKNNGTSAATNVVVSDALPAGFTFVSAVAEQGTYASNTWTVGTINYGASVKLRLTATMTAAALPSKTNTASLTSYDQFDSITANNGAGVTVTPEVIDLSLSMNASAIPPIDAMNPDLNDNVVFTLSIANASGVSSASGVAVKALLPTGLDYVSYTGSGTYDASTGVWTVGSLNSGIQASLAITAKVTTAGAKTFAAEVTAADQVDLDSVPNNGSGEDDATSVTVTTLKADLSLSSVVTPTNPNAGDNVAFTVTLSNAGPADADTAVGVTLPAGLSYVSNNPDAGSYSAGTGVWTVNSLASGASAHLEVVANVTAAIQLNYTISAAINSSDHEDPDSNDLTTQSTITLKQSDLSLALSVDDPTPQLFDNVVFTVTVSNAVGNDGATGVTVKNVLSAGLSNVNAVPSQGAYDAQSGQWTVGALSSGAAATLTLTGSVTTTALVTVGSEVIAANQFDPDSTPNNNNSNEDDQKSQTVMPVAADLSLAMTVDNNSPYLGTNVTYTITLSNDGPSTASGVTVSNLLPAGLAYVSSSPSQGSFDSIAGIWAAGTVTSNGNGVTLSITATATNLGAKVNTAEISALDQVDPDSTPNNGNLVEDDLASVTVTVIAYPAPTVATLAATSVTTTSATLNGTVNDNGVAAAVSFEYGTGTTYGTTVTGTPSSITAGIDSAVSANLTELLPNTTYHFRVKAINAGGTTDGFDMTFTTAVPMLTIESGPTATPSTASVGQTVVFSIAASDSVGSTVTYTWDIAGTAAIGASPTRIFTTPGTFTAVVSATSSLGGSASASVQVTVVAPAAGIGNDTDGDGFSDDFEIAAGTSASNAADSPTGGAVPTTAALIAAKLSIKLNFAKANLDSISFSGTLPVAAGFSSANKTITVDVGGVIKAITLDEKGKSKEFKLAVKATKGVVAAQVSKYSVKLQKGSFASLLADDGLVNSDAKLAGASVVMRVVFGSVIYEKTQILTYSAKAGKTGSAKVPR